MKDKKTRGYVAIKGVYYYTVVYLKDENGHRKQEWKATGLLVDNEKNTNGKKKRGQLVSNFAQAQLLLKKRCEEHDAMFNGDILELNYLTPFVEFVDIWLHEVGTLRWTTSTVETYEIFLKRIAQYYGSDGVKNIPISQITPEYIQRFIKFEIDNKYSPGSIKRAVTLLKAVVEDAFERKIIERNFSKEIKAPRYSKSIQSYYTADRLKELLKDAEGEPLEYIIATAAYLGLRRGEVLGLCWSKIDFDSNQVHICCTVKRKKVNGKYQTVVENKAKSATSIRSIRLPKQLKEKLEKLKKETRANELKAGNCYNKEYRDFLFVDALGNLYNPDYITRKFSQFLEKHGLEHMTFHGIRHSFAALAMKNGVPIPELSHTLGHASTKVTTDFYGHLDVNDTTKLIEGVAKALDNQSKSM